MFFFTTKIMLTCYEIQCKEYSLLELSMMDVQDKLLNVDKSHSDC